MAQEAISRWWRHSGRFLFKEFRAGVRNLIRWFPVIWRDRDYDDHYIFEIYKKKLVFQANYIRTKNRHTRAIRDADRMMTCVGLMDKIQSEYYCMEYMDYHKSDMNWKPYDADPTIAIYQDNDEPLYELEVILREENFDDYFKKYPHAYRVVTTLNPATNVFPLDSKQKIAMNMGYYLHAKCRRILFTLLERNVEGWWS